jgi:hypothetical protein
MIISSILAIILSILFLSIILLDKTCHTIPMMLIANSCFAGFLLGCSGLSFSLFSFQNDFKQIHFQDSLCIIRAYFGYASCTIFNLSFFVQAMYRYVTVVYPRYLFWQSIKFQIFFICLTWIFGYIHLLVYLFTDDIIYNVDNQICQIPLRFSLSIIYGTFCVYINPVLLIVLIYLKLFRYVHKMSKHIIPVNILSRAQRELKMVQRIIILIIILVVLGFPYTVFIIISFFTTQSKYHYRIGFLFIDLSLVFVMIVLFQFTKPLKMAMMKRINRRLNRLDTIIEMQNKL